MRSAINKLKQTQKIELNKLTQEIKDKVNYIEVFDVSGRLLQILPKNSSLSNSKLPKQQVLIIKLHYTDGGGDTISWLQN